MPYIDKEERARLDVVVEVAIRTLSEKSLDKSLGDLNYVISRVTAGLIGIPSYSKIAMTTGVLENVKQELYRRMASPYEDKKIEDNGDIKEYEEKP
jgi:hypothetical protein